MLEQLKMLSKKTIVKALFRALKSAVAGALAAFVMVPVDLSDPKKYFAVLGIAALTGALLGLQKLVSGYLKYDLKKKE